MKNFGIERQAQLIALIPILLIATLLESYFVYSRFEDLDHALLERSQLVARQLASSSEYSVFSGDSTLLKQHVDLTLSFQDVLSIQILDTASNTIWKAGKSEQTVTTVLGMRLIDQSRDILRLYEPILATQIRLEEIDRSDSLSTTVKPLGMVVIEFSKVRLNNQKTEIIILNLLITLIILSLTLMLSLRFARSITRPILGMRRAIIEIGKGALHTRIHPKPAIRELHDLAAGINNMALKLQDDRSHLQERINQATLELRGKKEEAEKASFSKTRFLAAASHDLRQPMHALGLFVGELQSIINTEGQRKVVQKVEASVEAMSGLLNSLLDISKLDAGIIFPQPLVFNIGSIFHRLEQDYNSLAKNKSIKLRVVPCSQLLLSDPVLLERILTNLVSNALRYTPSGGGVLVGCRKRGNNLRIEVRDNGIGIPLEEQKNIFQEFVQLANKERDRSMGLGLGLAIVERLSKLLNHKLYLQSAAGRGAMFAIEVPLASKADIKDEDTDSFQVGGKLLNVPSTGTPKVFKLLVVDDDPLVRSSTCGILASWGYQVSVAASWNEVKSKFKEQNFDLIICDYRLPDGTGLDVIHFMTLQQNRFIPCILVSGDTAPEILQKVTENGFNLLNKPVRPAKLRSLLQFLLSKES